MHGSGCLTAEKKDMYVVGLFQYGLLLEDAALLAETATTGRPAKAAWDPLEALLTATRAHPLALHYRFPSLEAVPAAEVDQGLSVEHQQALCCTLRRCRERVEASVARFSPDPTILQCAFLESRHA